MTKAIHAFLAVMLLIIVTVAGITFFSLYSLFGIIIPYLAATLFVAGFIYRIILWSSSPVPFHVPTVCGQQKSLPWIRADNRESPYNNRGLLWRMALEVLLFRSLFRNDRAALDSTSQRLVYGSNKYLWLGGLLFHWSLLAVVVRHLRFFTEPVPGFVESLQGLDGVFQLTLPAFYVTDVLILLALTYLFLRRVIFPQMRYISLAADYFAIFLLFGIVLSGVLMRHVYEIDVEAAKVFVMSVISLRPEAPTIGVIFYVHLFLVSLLFAYFPWSKLMHMGGVFLSPTRNLKNDSRARRHVNPWNYPVITHTYEEYEDEFRDALKEVGLPVDKE
jgi:nitrate reductase gamma subunit